MFKKRISLSLTVLMIAALACNLPEAGSQQPEGPNAAFTAAAQTVAAQLTGVALTQSAPGPTATQTQAVAETATPTVTATTAPAVPTVTPTVDNCDHAQFVTDVTVPDGTNIGAGAAFTKTWRLKNIGTCTWTTSYALAFLSGNSMSGPSAVGVVGNVNPGETVDLSVNLTAPTASGDYTGYWRLRNASGVPFITLSVVIHVGGAGGGAFAVIHVNYSTSTWNSPGYVNCPQVNAEIVTNGAGTVQYHWVRDDGDSTGGTLTFSAAGSQTVSAQWSLGSVWAGHDNWMGIYIDSPNHQSFGHTSITPCTSP